MRRKHLESSPSYQMTNNLNRPSSLQLISPPQSIIAQPTSPGSTLISSTSTAQSKAVLSENSEQNPDNTDSHPSTPLSDNVCDKE